MKKNIVKKDFDANMLPSNRRELFFDIFKNHFSTLVGIGLILLLFAIPFICLSVVGDYASYDLYNSLKNGDVDQETYKNLFQSTSLYLSLGQCISLMIFSIGAAGVTKIYKRLLFLEPVFFKEDFKLGIKDSWKTFLISYLILSLFIFLSRLMNFVNAGAFIKALPTGIIIVFVFPIFLMFTVHTTIYNSKFFTRLRLCSLLFTKTFFISMGASLIVMAPLALLTIKRMILKYIFVLIGLTFIIPVAFLLYFDIIMFIFDKHINKEIYPEIYRKGLIERK